MILKTQDQKFVTKNLEFGRLMTVPEVADRLRLKEGTVRKMISERRIDFVRPSSRSIRIPLEAVERIIATGFHPAISEKTNL